MLLILLMVLQGLLSQELHQTRVLLSDKQVKQRKDEHQKNQREYDKERKKYDKDREACDKEREELVIRETKLTEQWQKLEVTRLSLLEKRDCINKVDALKMDLLHVLDKVARPDQTNVGSTPGGGTTRSTKAKDFLREYNLR